MNLDKLRKATNLWVEYGLEHKFFTINKKFTTPELRAILQKIETMCNPHQNVYISFNLDEPYAEEILRIMARHHKWKKEE